LLVEYDDSDDYHDDDDDDTVLKLNGCCCHHHHHHHNTVVRLCPFVETQHCEDDVSEMCSVCVMVRFGFNCWPHLSMFLQLCLPEDAVLFITFCALNGHWMKTSWSALVHNNYNEDKLYFILFLKCNVSILLFWGMGESRGNV
jgi:hypothetical protein